MTLDVLQSVLLSSFCLAVYSKTVSNKAVRRSGLIDVLRPFNISAF